MKNIIFLAGYYGSGKTEIALNLAIKNHVKYLVDLDIINPYFRAREAKHLLNETELISSDLQDDKYSDLPYLSKHIFKPFNQEHSTAIYDLGGNDLGAKVMRQFDDYSQTDFDLYFVINIYRNESNEFTKILKLINQIEGSSGFKITGLINNSNLMRETTYNDILEGEKIVSKISKLTGIPYIFNCIDEKIYDKSMELNNPIFLIHSYNLIK
ncbi:MAG: hypothetical protein WCR19_00665 [Acholeplasmataceae bacterium]